ncbi:UPF0501 protein-like protein, partial [Stegodyphus mimosarum]
MSVCVGLSASQADLDVQGEIDFDFFEESDQSNICNTTSTLQNSVSTDSKEGSKYVSDNNSENCMPNDKLDFSEHGRNVSNIPESCSSRNFSKPLITVSCDGTTGTVQTTNIETVIPSPFHYKDNKCGKISPCNSRKARRLLSPRLKSKIFRDDNEISDDSSLSSMSESESESDISSVSDDSFELNEESDSMTDVSPLVSPFECHSPAVTNNDSSDVQVAESSPKLPKKDGVKFTDDIGQKGCVKCESIDLHELLKAVKRLEMEQNINAVSLEKCRNPSVITQNARCRRNLSFSNEEVRRIDNDNQILLKKIRAQENRTKARNNSTVRVLSSSAVNRQRQQRQIELDNLALLKRLESTKASRDLSRFHLLRDYDRRSSGVLSRASSRSSQVGNSSQTSCRTSSQSSGRSSAVSLKLSNSSAMHSR